MILSTAKCPYCGWVNGFKAELIEVQGYNYKLVVIKCGSCNSAISFMEYLNIGVILTEIKQKLDAKG